MEVKRIFLVGSLIFLQSIAALGQPQIPVQQAQPAPGKAIAPTATSLSQPSGTPTTPSAPPSPKVVTSTACNKESESDGINVPFEKFDGMRDDKTHSLVIPESGKCYGNNQKTKLFTVEEESALIYKRTVRGEALIYKAELITWESAMYRTSLLLTKDDRSRIEEHLKRRDDQKNRNVWVLTFKVVSILDKNPQGGGVPPHHPSARTINHKELQKAIAQGNKVYDIRPKKLFKKGHFKNAVQVQVKRFDDISERILPTSRLRQLNLPKQIFPTDKSQALYLHSSCPAEYASYNMITILRDRGYKNIHWLRGGMTTKKGIASCETPDALAGVKTVNGNDIADIIKEQSPKKKVFIYDLRSGSDKINFGYFIKGSQQLHFKQKMNAMNIPSYRAPNMTPTSLFNEKEKLKGISLKNKKATVILFGENEYDWAPFKTAVILKGQGYLDVRWYRGGMADWKIGRAHV